MHAELSLHVRSERDYSDLPEKRFVHPRLERESCLGSPAWKKVAWIGLLATHVMTVSNRMHTMTITNSTSEKVAKEDLRAGKNHPWMEVSMYIEYE